MAHCKNLATTESAWQQKNGIAGVGFVVAPASRRCVFILRKITGLSPQAGRLCHFYKSVSPLSFNGLRLAAAVTHTERRFAAGRGIRYFVLIGTLNVEAIVDVLSTVRKITVVEVASSRRVASKFAAAGSHHYRTSDTN